MALENVDLRRLDREIARLTERMGFKKSPEMKAGEVLNFKLEDGARVTLELNDKGTMLIISLAYETNVFRRGGVITAMKLGTWNSDAQRTVVPVYCDPEMILCLTLTPDDMSAERIESDISYLMRRRAELEASDGED